jgi:mono/diheme cytochrome c family protein
MARPFFVMACCLLVGCQQQMARQPSARPDEASSFFPDGRLNRPLPAGTIARGQLRSDVQLFSGHEARPVPEWRYAVAAAGAGSGSLIGFLAILADQPNDELKTFPFPITRAVLEHGRNRYMIYCVVCHDPLGTGQGKIVERGYTPPPSYHSERLRAVPVGHFYEVITNGYGSMPEHKQQIPPRDRWAIAAYIRALQLSQHFAIADLPANLRQEWEQQDGNVPAGRQEP